MRIINLKLNIFPNTDVVDSSVFFLIQIIVGDIYAFEIHPSAQLSPTQELFIHPSRGLCG